MIEPGPDGQIYLRCASGDLVSLFVDSSGGVVVQLPAPFRGLPRAVLTHAEARELVEAVTDLLDSESPLDA